MIAILVAAVLKVSLPQGNAEKPAFIVPTAPARESVAFWWDDKDLHIGTNIFAWAKISKNFQGAVKDGTAFKCILPADPTTLDGEVTEVEGRIDFSAPRLRIDARGAIGNSDVSNRVTVIPQKDAAISIAYLAAGQTPDYLVRNLTKSAKAHQETSFDIVGRGPSSGTASLAVSNEKQQNFYRAYAPFHAPGLIFDFKYLYANPEKMQLHVCMAGWTKNRADYRLRIVMKDLISNTLEAWQQTQIIPALTGKGEVIFDVKDLPSGFYWANLEYLDAAGNTIHTDKARFMKPNAPMPWEGTTLGASDTVPPPWTAPVFGADTFECWNRAIHLGGEGLITSIRNGGVETLTAPITLWVEGKPLSFKVVRKEVHKASAIYQFENVRTAATSPTIAVKLTCMFDGYMRFDVTYPTAITSLACEIPVARDKVMGFDDCSAEDNPNVLAPKKMDGTWAYNPEQRPFWWIPGPLGLMGGMLNLHGTYVRQLAKARTVSSAGNTLKVRTVFVDEKPPQGPNRTISFYLEPTPVKPKNLQFASLDASKITLWTGHLCDFFEMRYPGFADDKLFDRYREDLLKGKRVFFYNGSRGESPESPIWNWYRRDWCLFSPDYYAREAPIFEPIHRQHGNWTCGCLANRGFFEHKIWGVNWYLHDPVPAMKDLYFDLANPQQCYNPAHTNCTWRDEFGRLHHDWSTEALRDFHLRAYRLVKAKNPDGVMYGHTGCRRYPGDVFFDLITTGESLARKVCKNFTYYEVFTPEMMQSYFVPRAQELVVYTPPQFTRARQCWAPHLLATYNSKEPETDRAIRHCVAYLKIHDILVSLPKNAWEGAQFYAVDSAIRNLGTTRHYEAYYHESPTCVTISAPHPRFLWAWYRAGDKGILVLLNDTDETKVETIRLKDVSCVGKELLDGTAFDFTTGAATITFPPRGAKFIAFDFPPAWPKATADMKPWVYNWWMASAVDEKGLEAQCAALESAGFGGFHIIPIYGAKGYEKKYRAYLSPDWMNAFKMAVEIGQKHGLGVDMTTGCGWCFGGMQLTKEEGCWKLEATPNGAAPYIVPKLTGQQVKRAGPGGKGPMMDPYSPEAMESFLKPFTQAFGAKLTVKPLRMYHDSFEYFESAWTPKFFEYFKQKRGYDLRAHWDAFAGGKGSADEIARLKCDYRETLSDLIVEDVFPKWVDWCHTRGIETRNEAHGAPANWLDFYDLADYPETEMFGERNRDILISKFASSVAHVGGKKFTSAESCTWLNEHFTETPLDYKRFLDKLLLAGVDHVYYHGCCYSPVDAVWPGWCFYASSETNPRNPLWRDFGTLNGYLTRIQALSQTTECDNDILLYWPIHDLWMNTNGFARAMNVHHTEWFDSETIGPIARALQDAGYAFDYVSDRQLQKLAFGMGHYRNILIPPVRAMPLKTARRLIDLAAQGFQVGFIGGYPTTVPGFNAWRQQSAELNALFARRHPNVRKGSWEKLAPIRTHHEYTARKLGLSYVRRTRNNTAYYFMVNETNRVVRGTLAVTAPNGAVWKMDPMAGSITPIPTTKGAWTIEIPPYGSMIYAIQAGVTMPHGAPKMPRYGKPRALLTTWELTPLCGGPNLPRAQKFKTLHSWARKEDGAEEPFCGTMRYKTTFTATPGKGMRLDFGDVRESIRVCVNGTDLGCVLMPPYRFEVPAKLVRAENELVAEVTNTGANRIRWNDKTGVNWKYFTDANVLGKDYRALNAANWPLREAGILGPVMVAEEAP